MLMGQYGIGDPAQGSTYTLASITAVVLGGTSLLGGRGTFVGPLLGAVLLQQTLNATVFLDLGTVSSTTSRASSSWPPRSSTPSARSAAGSAPRSPDG